MNVDALYDLFRGVRVNHAIYLNETYGVFLFCFVFSPTLIFIGSFACKRS